MLDVISPKALDENSPVWRWTHGGAEFSLLMPMEGRAGGGIEGDRDDIGNRIDRALVSARSRDRPGSIARRCGSISPGASRHRFMDPGNRASGWLTGSGAILPSALRPFRASRDAGCTAN